MYLHSTWMGLLGICLQADNLRLCQEASLTFAFLATLNIGMLCVAGEAPKWTVGRAASTEKALNGACASVATIAAALRAVADDVVPGDVPDAAFLASAAEGLLFEALAATLKPVCALCYLTTHRSLPYILILFFNFLFQVWGSQCWTRSVFANPADACSL